MYSYAKQTLKAIDPDLWALVQQERSRQEQHIALSASENHTSPAVMAAQGSQLTNTPAEGPPGCRDHSANEYADLTEQLALDRLQRLFGADQQGWAASVRPHSGAQANEAVFKALLNPGDTFMGMGAGLADGGPFGQGWPSQLGDKWFKAVAYGLSEGEDVDHEALLRQAQATRPKLLVADASACGLRIDFARFAQVAKEVGALFMVDMAHHAGLIAAGVYPNPIPHADIVTGTTHTSLRGPRGGLILMRPDLAPAIHGALRASQQGGPLVHVIAAKAVAFKEALEPGFKSYQEQVLRNARALAETLIERGLRIVGGRTDSHLMWLDLRSQRLTGQEAEALLSRAHLTVNQSPIPNDTASPATSRGLRLGAGALTTRGLLEAESRKVAHLIADLLARPYDALKLTEVRGQVALLTRQFPIYE